MVKNEERALKIAEFLLQIKAVRLQPNNPFTWSSGWKSPMYCDNRIVLSYPKVRTYIRQGFSEVVNEVFDNTELIAGVATGGIPHGALVAQDLGLPFVYVRPEAKGHGMKNQVEGVVTSEQRTVVIEDLVSTGKSSINAIAALKESGVRVEGIISIFDYGFDIARTAFETIKCPLYSLCDYRILLKKALESGYINKNDHESLSAWRENPENWMQKLSN